jgi:hypothetical protein
MNAVVFSGPSLDLAAARAACPDLPWDRIDWQPPARMGDVYRAALGEPAALLIIDGYFEQVPSVWHKEVLFALSRGIRVLGAASMGALRAAELHPFGMQGVGRVYQAYAEGSLEDDDEVALVHGQDGGRYTAASEALVNMRFALADAHAAGLLDTATQDHLLALAKARFYPQRSWPALWHDAAAAGLPEALLAPLQAHLARTAPNQKRDDALAGLCALAGCLQPGAAAAPAVPFVFEHTLYWETVENYFGHAAAAGAGALTAERLRNHVRLFDPQRDHCVERALLLSLVEQEARRLRLDPGDDAAVLRRFRRRHGLHGAQALAEWMARQGVDAAGCLRLARAEHLLREVAQRRVAQVDAWLDDVLRLEGRRHRSLAEAQGKWQHLREQGLERAAEADVGDTGRVLAWYQQQWGRIDGDLADHVAERGFGSMRHFLDELFAQYLVRQDLATPQAAA